LELQNENDWLGVSAGLLTRRLLRYRRPHIWVSDSSMSPKWT
jgi:hypothetical protein